MATHQDRMVSKLRSVRACATLPRNVAGRDFVVGDLHGHRAVFEQELVRLNFDPAVDRVFSVGDLVDRGPDSLGTLALLEQPWFHAVLGNHDLMLLEALGCCSLRASGRKARAAAASTWIVQALSDHRKRLTRLAESLRERPLAIDVEADLPFRVVHSDLDTPDLESILVDDRQASVPVSFAERLTTSRLAPSRRAGAGGLLLRYQERPVEVGVQPLPTGRLTYLGHTPMPHLGVHAGRVYLEQGLGGSGRFATRVPTVLDTRHFGLWLRGVVTALDLAVDDPAGPGARSVKASTKGTIGPAADRPPLIARGEHC